MAVQPDLTVRTHTEERADLLAQAVENSSELIGMADREGHFTLANRAFLQTLGYSKEEVIGKHFGSFHSANNPPTLNQEIGEKSLEDGGWQGECLLCRQDGTDLPVLLSVGPAKDKEGRVIGSFGIARDISDRKRAEESLRRSEEQFRELAENIRDVFFILTPDPFRVTYLSPAYEEIWKRPRQEVYDRASAWIDPIHPEDRERAIRIFEQAQRGEAAATEYRIARPDGSVRWVSARTFPIHGSDGKFCRTVGFAEDITERKQAESTLREAHVKLGIALGETEQRALEATHLAELVDILQACQSVEEACQIIGNTLPATLSRSSGALCITAPSRNMVEAVATWGDGLATEKTFAPEDCWALRRGKIHRVKDSASPLRCAHVGGSPAGGYLCVPLSAHGETLGVLCLESPCQSPNPSLASPEDQMEAFARQAGAAGERISLALANLRLRDALRSQSIRDPLTGLFNRRYMEESLEREVHRAARNKECVTLLMLDIDHFKQFNDTFGHQAGDMLLRALGGFLSERTRGQDVACRYGGEEFVLILTGTSIDGASELAELLCRELKQLTVQHVGNVLGKITVSIGISAFPGHGATAEELLCAADQALYRAKAEGRDRFVVASPAGPW